MSPRQKQVLDGLLNGEGLKGTAGRLGVSPNTVSWHVGYLRRKYRAQTTEQLIGILFRKGILV